MCTDFSSFAYFFNFQNNIVNQKFEFLSLKIVLINYDSIKTQSKTFFLNKIFGNDLLQA